MNSFYEKLAEILEVDQVKPGDEIASFDNWDSLGVLSILALADSEYGVTVSGEEIAGMKVVGELEKLIVQRANK
ncbi:MAG TPA: acyl carrier protein [Kofleriaceae bacterium]|nr:acyl carrier protein [Kofleriaceae bacterium]